MCPWVGSHAPSCGWQLLGAAQPCGVSLTTGAIAPASLRYDCRLLWLELQGPAAGQATPFWAVCRLACHRLLPWLGLTFAMVPDAARPGSDQWPWSAAPGTGPADRLGRPSSSDPRGVVCWAPSLCYPSCVCAYGVRGLLALVHQCARPVCSLCGVPVHLALLHLCARCVRHARDVAGLIAPPPSLCFCVFFSA